MSVLHYSGDKKTFRLLLW